MKIAKSVLLLLLVSSLAQAQQSAPKPESQKYRTIFTIAGAAGGFATGTFVGLSAFDDDVNSDRKVWTTAVVGAGAGAVGGYFIGRVLDRKKKTAGLTTRPGTAAYDLRVAPVLSRQSKGVQLAMRF